MTDKLKILGENIDIVEYKQIEFKDHNLELMDKFILDIES